MKSSIIILAMFLIVGALDSTRIYGSAPAWWSEQEVTTSNPVDDYAVANIGQLKHIATKAVEELNDNLPGGARFEVNQLVAAWAESPAPGVIRDDYAAVNLGQLKAVAKPFYDRLIEVGYTSEYPWTGGQSDDYALANLGQLKNVFSFDVTFDSDADNLPDWWETSHFPVEALSVEPGDDLDGDGLTNLEEYEMGADPDDPDDPIRFVFDTAMDSTSFEADVNYAIVNENGDALTVANASRDEGANIEAGTFRGAIEQAWRFEEDAGEYTLFALCSNRATEFDGSNVEQGSHDGSFDWVIDTPSSGSFRIRRASGTDALSVDPSGNVEVGAYTGSPNQRWKVYKLKTSVTEQPDFTMTGWATLNGGTTGGEGGEIVTARSREEFLGYITSDLPYIILVDKIDMKDPADGEGDRYYVSSNKTIWGIGSEAHIKNAELRIGDEDIQNPVVSNVIIRNLKFTFPDKRSDGTNDAIAVTHGATNVWIDHNDLSDYSDGLVDITRAADFVTVSWNRFGGGHEKVSNIGNNDGDNGEYRVTYHHNWHGETVVERMPRVRFGRVHVFNNYYKEIDGGIQIGYQARIFAEGNFFQDAGTEYYLDYEDPPNGHIPKPGYYADKNTIYRGGALDSNVTDVGVQWDPAQHYAYRVNHADNVPNLVESYAKVGIVDVPSFMVAKVTHAEIDGTGSDWIQLKWRSIYHAENYQIKRAEPDGTFVISTVAGDKLIFRDENLTSATQYEYRVRATNQYATGSWSDPIVTSTD